jgi:hypothetical protein
MAGLGRDHILKFVDACGGEMGGRGGATNGFGPPGPAHIGLGGWCGKCNGIGGYSIFCSGDGIL